MRDAQVNLAIRWFIGYGLHEALPDHSSLTRIRQRWGAARFWRILQRTVEACVAGIATGEVVDIDSSLVRAGVRWDAIARHHAEAFSAANGDAAGHDRSSDQGDAGSGCAPRYSNRAVLPEHLVQAGRIQIAPISSGP